MHFYSSKHSEKKCLIPIKKFSFPVVTSLIFMATVLYWNNQNYGLALEYNGQQIATVNHERVYEEAEQLIRNQTPLNEKHKISKANTKLKVSTVEKKECCEKPETVKNKIIENSGESLKSGFAVYIKGKVVAVSDSKEEIEKILDQMLKDSKKQFENSTAIFTDEIEIKEELFPSEKIQSKEEINKKINSKVENTVPYLVKETDSIVSIAEKFGMKPETLLAINNKKHGESIYPGDVINVIETDTLLHIKIIAHISEETEIPYKTVTNEDPDLEKGKIITVTQGINGKEKVNYNVTYLDGKEIKKEEIKREIILNPVDQEETIGTKKEEFIWPVPYTFNITSPYGLREKNEFHRGIDIASYGVFGKDIVAAKDGTIEVSAMSNRGYGNHIIIDHNDGTKTVYGHCSSLNVKKGQSVKQGDVIAKVGTTGQSTGPHLHFEIRKRENSKSEYKAINPIEYLKNLCN